MHSQVQSELRRLMLQVAKTLHFIKGWANDEVTLFLSLLRDPKDLYDRSIQQGLLLYDGTNLQIYGVLWLWVLVRKLKRLQMEDQHPREVDWSDCVAITRRIVEETGAPIDKASLKEFDHTEREPPVYDTTVHAINEHYSQLFGHDGFAN